QAVKSYESAERTLTQEVRGAADQANTAADIAAFYRDQSIPLAQRNLELSMQTYRAGQASLLQVLELQRFVLDTRSKYVQAARDAATKLAQLESAVGMPLRDIRGSATTQPAPVDSAA